MRIFHFFQEKSAWSVRLWLMLSCCWAVSGGLSILFELAAANNDFFLGFLFFYGRDLSSRQACAEEGFELTMLTIRSCGIIIWHGSPMLLFSGCDIRCSAGHISIAS